MDRADRLKSQPTYYSHSNRRHIVSKIIVIVNVTTLFINLNRQAEASSIKPHSSGQLTRTTSSAQIEGANSSSSSPSTQQQQEQRHRHLHSKQLADSALGSRVSDGNDQPDLKLANNLDTNALIYLQKYGYMNAHLNAEANNLISEDSFSGAISSFQRFAGIPETGTIDNQTLRYMQMPRCGNVDKPHDSLGGPYSRLMKAALLGSIRRRKRYALQGSKWRRQELTYRISQYPTRFNGKRHEVDAQIEKAFGIWSQVAPINFVVKKDGRVHIDIRFASGDHGDGDAFDGPGNTLAHAYFPQYGGDAHFDDQEYWTIDSYAGTNIFQVAAHELGHSLGLGHSNVREALMAPFYQKYKPNFKLHIDDVLAIQALYGDKPFLPEVPQTSSSTVYGQSPSSAQTTTTTSTPTTTSTTASPLLQTTTTTAFRSPTTTRYSILPTTNRKKPGIFGLKPDQRETNDDENGILPDLSTTLGGNGIGPNGGAEADTNSAGGVTGGVLPGSGINNYPADLCTDPTIDAITRTEDGSSYVFKGEYYWLLTNEGLARGYPRKVSTDWEGLPGSIDAALTWADGKTFFFKGNKYWRYRNRRRDLGYPKLISVGFAGIPDDIDAAFVWSGNGRTYIFKGTEYWRFDSKADPPVSSEYPRSIKVWNGVPSYINAAFKWDNNVTYFFKGGQYYRFNDKEFKVESRGRPPFPRLSAEWWFGCVSSNLAQRALPGVSSSLRDSVAATTTSTTPPQDNNNSQDIDWSFFAGLEENTRIMGTHISDHHNDSARSPETSPNTDQVNHHHNNNGQLGPRIGLYHPVRTVSSSAIASKYSVNNLVVMLASMPTTITALLLTRSIISGRFGAISLSVIM